MNMDGSKKTHPVRVIGCGNVLAGDDGVGITVVRKLEKENGLPAGVIILEAGVPGLSLVEMMLGAEKVILVDAFLSELPPGTVKRFLESDLPPVGFTAGQSHGIGLREAVSFARKVLPGDAPAEIVVVGIGIQPPRRWTENLSSPVKQAVATAADMVKAEVLACMKYP